MDIDVDADNDVEMDAKLPALSQSLDLIFPFALTFGFTEHRSAAAASASLEVPVNVDTGLVFVEANVCVSKLVRLLKEAAAELSCPCTGGRVEHASGSAFGFARPDPSSRPSLMYRSDCDDFLVFEESGFTQPPSSSVESEIESKLETRDVQGNRIKTRKRKKNEKSAKLIRSKDVQRGALLYAAPV